MEENEIIEHTEELTELVPEETTEEVAIEEVPQEETDEIREENELLIEYIKQQLEENIEEEEINENDQNDIYNDGAYLRSGSDIESVDYSEDILTELEIITGYIEEYNRNNTLQSDIEDISLTNALLIVVFIGILFTAALNFSRRIF